MPIHHFQPCSIPYEELSGLYFAYGANMNPEQIRARCGSPVVVGAAKLPDHSLAFFGYSRTWDGAVETLVSTPGRDVWGVLYQLGYSDWDTLDSWQDVRLDGTGAYFHYPVRVTDSAGNTRTVLLYKKDNEGEPAKPSTEYLAHIIRGAVERKLPADYVERLRQFESKKAGYEVPRRGRFDRAQIVASLCSGCTDCSEAQS